MRKKKTVATATYADAVRARDPLVWEVEGAKLDATDLIAELMNQQKVTKTELAKRLHVTQAAVTGYLSGSRNLTVEKLTEILFVLGHKPKFTAEKLTTRRK